MVTRMFALVVFLCSTSPAPYVWCVEWNKGNETRLVGCSVTARMTGGELHVRIPYRSATCMANDASGDYPTIVTVTGHPPIAIARMPGAWPDALITVMCVRGSSAAGIGHMDGGT